MDRRISQTKPLESTREASNLAELVQQGRQEEAESLLNQKFEVSAAVGERSTKVALEAATRLFAGNLRATIFWMNRRMYGSDDTPLQAAERSEEDMGWVINRIGQIEGGVYI
ncbi:hypothetical protein [Allosphingosinicella humi]